MMVGILGGGQLGRMLVLAGYPLGLKFRVLDPSPDAPARELADHVIGSYEDPNALERFARNLHVVTYEFENVPVSSVKLLARQIPVYPPPDALEVSQDRFVEKTFLQDVGVPTPEFARVESHEDLHAAIGRLGLPGMLKTQRLGYDGKGQFLLKAAGDAEAAWKALQGMPLIFEKFVAFEREVSILAMRNRDEKTGFYPLVENRHDAGILRCTFAPAADLTPGLQSQAETYAVRVLEALRYVGVLAIEFFQVGDRLIANEIAPRVHNSGHWTIEGAETSQFENHLRAVSGLPLGLSSAIGCSAMLNIIGQLPEPENILSVPGAHLHTYGKSPRAGRKLGHVTVHAPDRDSMETRYAQLHERLFGEKPGTAH
ncbi:MAG: 5-(carboxyamino)imidazole ribonucleotide synthase [Nitrospirae bacterium]|nr:MAG: 5-(carboxyamino)imidazole ribonucleotide synthase [Nitrospirota bacterium]